MTERVWTARDYYRLRRDDAGVLRCERVRSQRRDVAVIPVGDAMAFDAGPAAEARGRVLAVSMLADLLEASPRAEDYEVLSGVEGIVWDLHRSFHARWLQGLRVDRGGSRELDSHEFETWIAEEARTLLGPE